MSKRNIVAVFIALTIGLASFAARAVECPLYPQVSWWKNVNHESVKKYVANRHDGEWTDYTNKWKQQLNKLLGVQAKGGSIVTPTGTKLKGIDLENYINQVRQRVKVNNCLALEAIAPTKNLATTAVGDKSKLDYYSENVRGGDPVAGKVAVRQAGCFSCHGIDGRSKKPEVPNLAGQKPVYLVKQLMAFAAAANGIPAAGQKNVRFHEFMSKKAAKLSHPEMDNIAAYFAGL